MKICIWITKIFDLGGTKRVVSLLANELVKEHEVTIMTYEDRFREDRTMYHLSEDINVDFIDNSQFVNKHHTPAFCARYLVKKLNDRSGMFNKRNLNPILAEAIFPKKGALACKPEEIMKNPEVDKTRKLVICCSRGINSKEIAKKLEEEGLDAVSLEKGYIAWLMDAMKSSQDEDFAKNVEISLRKKFKKKIWSRFTKAINTYELVKPGDRIAVCISGGKDSMLMAKCFQELKLHNKFDFEVKFLVMDPGYSPANRQVIEENARRLNIPIRIFESDIFESVFNVEKSPCYLCARMRRGHLYAFAKEMGATKSVNFKNYSGVEALADAVKEAFGGYYADFGFQCTGSPVAHANVYKFIRKGGGLCELGFFINGGDATINPHFDICAKEITTVGSWVYTLRDYATTFDFLKRAKGIGLPMEKLITHKFPLAQINEAHKTNLAMEGLKIAIINE